MAARVVTASRLEGSEVMLQEGEVVVSRALIQERARRRGRKEERTRSRTHHSNNVLLAASFSSSPPIPHSA